MHHNTHVTLHHNTHVTSCRHHHAALPGVAIIIMSGGRRRGVHLAQGKQVSEKASAVITERQPYTCTALLQKTEAPVFPLLKEPYTKRACRQKRQSPLRKSPTHLGLFCKRKHLLRWKCPFFFLRRSFFNERRPYTCRTLLQKTEAPVSPLLKEPYTKRAFQQKQQSPLRKSPTHLRLFCKRKRPFC